MFSAEVQSCGAGQEDLLVEAVQTQQVNTGVQASAKFNPCGALSREFTNEVLSLWRRPGKNKYSPENVKSYSKFICRSQFLLTTLVCFYCQGYSLYFK